MPNITLSFIGWHWLKYWPSYRVGNNTSKVRVFVTRLEKPGWVLYEEKEERGNPWKGLKRNINPRFYHMAITCQPWGSRHKTQTYTEHWYNEATSVNKVLGTPYNQKTTLQIQILSLSQKIGLKLLVLWHCQIAIAVVISHHHSHWTDHSFVYHCP